MKDAINILLVSNHRYFPGLVTTMASMLLSASYPERLQFYVYHDDLSRDDKMTLDALMCKFGGLLPIVYRRPNIEEIKSLGREWNGSYLPWVRLFVCHELPVDWIVYADVDTLWFKDVCKLWEERDEKIPVFACADMEYVQKDTFRYQSKWNPHFQQKKYFCSGMMLMNVAAMRRFDLPRQVVSFVREYGCPYYPDQDILNYFYNEQCVVLDQTWNCMRPTRDALNGVVLHCLGIGRMFGDLAMTGWSPLSAIWFKFYNSIILGKSERSCCRWYKRIWFSIYGLMYPMRALYRMLTLPCLPHRAEQLCMLQFGAWLYKRLKMPSSKMRLNSEKHD